jgi:hypothetical protein
MSDRIDRSNFASDMNEWSVYMTIGTLYLKTSQMPSTHSVIVVALLQIPIKIRKIPQKRLDEQGQTN